MIIFSIIQCYCYHRHNQYHYLYHHQYYHQINVLNIPSVIVSLSIEDQETHMDSMPSTRPYQFELSKESLDTMIEGFGRIRDQLTKIST